MKYFRLLFLLVDQRNDDYDNEKTATGTDYYGDHGSIVLRTNLSSRSIIAFKKIKKNHLPWSHFRTGNINSAFTYKLNRLNLNELKKLQKIG